MSEEQVKQQPAAGPKDAVLECLHPEEVDWNRFKVGEDQFEVKPLPFGAARVFRKYAVPIIGARLQPVESIIAGLTKDTLKFRADFGFFESIVDTESTVDSKLDYAMAAVCAAQRPLKDKTMMESVEHWREAIDEKMTRKALLDAFEAQVKVEEEVVLLGKSLSARFKSLGDLVGKNLDVPSLLQGLISHALKSSEPTGREEISSSSAGVSTEEPSTTT